MSDFLEQRVGDRYIPNRACYCGRCRLRGFMGPAVLVTLGVLFLIAEFTHWGFVRTWPILLIVIGLVKILGSSGDITGHVPPFGLGVAGPPPPGSAAPPQQPPQPPQEVNHV